MGGGHFNNPQSYKIPEEFNPADQPNPQHHLDNLRGLGESQKGVEDLYRRLAPYSPTTIVDKNGKTVNVLAFPQGSEDVDDVSVEGYWDLEVNTEDEDNPVFKLLTRGAAVTPPATVEINKSFTLSGVSDVHAPVDANILYLHAVKNSGGDVDISVRYDSGWDGLPSNYTVGSDRNGNDSMESYSYPLYFTFPITASLSGVTFTVGEFILKKLVPSASLQVNNGFFRPESGAQVISVIDFSSIFEPFA